MQKKNLTELVDFIFRRASKLESERRYNRHHAPEMILFKEIAISFHFTKGLSECDARLYSVTLNDLTSHNELEVHPSGVFRAIDVIKSVCDLWNVQ